MPRDGRHSRNALPPRRRLFVGVGALAASALCLGAAMNAAAGESAAPTPDTAREIYMEELRKGVALLRQGRAEDFSRARGALQAARMQNPSSPEPRYWLALLEMAQQSISKAQEQAKSAVELAGDGFPEAYLLRGQLALHDHDFQRALEDLSRADELISARVAAAGGRPDRALVLTRFNLGRLHYHRTAGKNADPRTRAADLQRARELFKTASAYLQEMALRFPELWPTWVESLLYQGWCAYDAKDYFAAESFFRQAALAAAERPADGPDDKRIDAAFWMGLCARHGRRPAEALALFEETLAGIREWRRLYPRRTHPLYADALLQAASLYWQPETANRETGVHCLREFVKSTRVHPALGPVTQFLKKYDAEHAARP